MAAANPNNEAPSVTAAESRRPWTDSATTAKATPALLRRPYTTMTSRITVYESQISKRLEDLNQIATYQSRMTKWIEDGDSRGDPGVPTKDTSMSLGIYLRRDNVSQTAEEGGQRELTRVQCLENKAGR